MYLGILPQKLLEEDIWTYTYAKLSEKKETTKEFEGLRIRENLKPRFFLPEDNMIYKSTERKEISFMKGNALNGSCIQNIKPYLTKLAYFHTLAKS